MRPDTYLVACPNCAQAKEQGRSPALLGHPFCKDCGVLMGAEHAETHVADLCFNCEKNKATYYRTHDPERAAMAAELNRKLAR